MMKEFKTLVKNDKVDLIKYIKEFFIQKPNTEILIGCDSQNRKRETVYAIVIGLYTPKKGAHVLYSRFTTPRERDNTTRLLQEVGHSVEIAEKILNEVGVRATWIDIDLNPDPKYKSNDALASAVGWVVGMGYKVRHKGNSPMMSYCADSLVK